MDAVNVVEICCINCDNCLLAGAPAYPDYKLCRTPLLVCCAMFPKFDHSRRHITDRCTGCQYNKSLSCVCWRAKPIHGFTSQNLVLVDLCRCHLQQFVPDVDCSHLGATDFTVDATAIDFSRSAFAVTATSACNQLPTAIRTKHPSTRLK